MSAVQGFGLRPAFEAIMSQLPGAIYAIDDTGRLIYVSAQIERLVGYSAASLVRAGQLWSSIVYPEDAGLVHEHLSQSRGAGSVPTQDYRLVHRDGTVVWVRDYGIELEARGKRIRQGALLDITGQRAAEQALSTLELHYESILDTADEVIVRVDTDQRISFVSPAARRMLGWAPDELLGRAIADLVHPADRSRIGTAKLQATAEAEPRITFRAMQANGEWMWVNSVVRATRDPQGRVDGVQLVLRDVSAAERASAELTAAERMLRTMLDAVDEGFILETATGETFAMNRRARELLGPLGVVRDRLPPGWKLLDSGGLPISATVGPTRVVLENDKPLSGTIHVERSDGSRVWLAVDCRPLHRAGERQPFAALVGYADVTARAQSSHERQALQAEKALRREAEEIAQRLRSVFAPPRPPATPGVSLATLYIPAAEGVSGDWHDAIPLPDGTLGLAIGDVTGHGIEAAAMMGTLRAALHAYALEMHEPSVVLDRLNVVLMQAGARMASVLYAILDAEEGIVRFASAGHPPLLLIDPEGEVSFLRLGRSPLLGHEYPRERPQAIASLEPGSTLMMYTDGVLEGGCNSVDEALERLAASVAGAVGVDPQSLCTRVLPGSDPREDDAALLICRLDEIGEAELILELEADPGQLPVLRRAVAGWLERLGVGRNEGFQLLLAADEAARNAVEHAYGLESGSFAVGASCSDDIVTIRVSDAGQWRPPGRRRRGRGIPLMRKLVDQMEIRDLRPGTEILLTQRVNRG
jgi:PAS domain S-box-containing protein